MSRALKYRIFWRDLVLFVLFVLLVFGCGFGVLELLLGVIESSVFGEGGIGIGELVRVFVLITCLRVIIFFVLRIRLILL